MVLIGVALLFFIAHSGIAFWGLAILLLILNLGLLLEGSAAKFPQLAMIGIALSWVALGYFWSRAALAEILIPALLVVAAFAIIAMVGMISQRKRSTGDEACLVGHGIFLGLAGHLFLFVVASERSLAVPPYPLLGTLLLLDLAAGMAVLYTRRHELMIAVSAASALILMVWAGVAVETPYPSVAMIAAAALVLFTFVWIYLAGRVGMKTAPFAGNAAAAVFLAQFVSILAAEQTGAPGVGFLIPIHLLFLGALLALAWFRSQHYLVAFAVLPSGAAVSLWMAAHGEPEFALSQWLFAGCIYLVFLVYPMFLGRRAGRSLAPYLAAVLASVPFFFQARHTLTVIGLEDIMGVLPVAQAVIMAGLLWRLLRIDPPGERALGRLALVAGTALAFVTVAILLKLEQQWVTVGWALEGAALAWLYLKIPHRGLSQ